MPQPGVSAQARRMARSCCLKSSGRLRGDADAAPAQEGIRFRRTEPFARQLVAAGVQRAEDDAVGRAAFRQLLVVACLFLLVRHAGWIAQQEEFRAEESHAFRPHLLDAGVFMGEFHVDGKADVAAVPGDGRQVPQRFQRLVGLFLFHLEAVVVLHRLLRGLQDEHSLVAVQDGGGVAFHPQEAWSSPTTAGMPMERARMAVWETEEPISVAKP